MFNWKDISIASLILLGVVFYTCKKSTLQASIHSPENKASNFIPQLEHTLKNEIIDNDALKIKEKLKINWISFNEAYVKCKKNPRPILVDIYTTWCGPCKMMSTLTFNDSTIANYINENFYAVKFNAEGKDTVKFDKYSFVSSDAKNPKATHQFAASILDNDLSYPSVVFLNNQIQRLDIIKGFIPAENFEPILNYYGSGDYQSTKWEDYKAKFKGTIK